MEARLSGARRIEVVPPLPAVAEEVPAAVDSVPLVDGMPPLWPDETAESAMVTEFRGRGETPPRPLPATAPAEVADATSLPALSELVARIPADVRDALDDLFRAKFVAVKRVPHRALKD